MCITMNNKCKEKLASRYSVMLHKVTHCAGHDVSCPRVIGNIHNYYTKQAVMQVAGQPLVCIVG